MTELRLDERGLVPFEAVRAAAGRLRGVARETPLRESGHLSRALGADVRLKPECNQHTGSFKLRGAYNYVASLPDEEVAAGVITFSSGNHAQAVAFAAGERGVPATVVMPVTAPAVKRKGAEELGARVVLEGTTSLERRRRADQIRAAEGQHMVPPFDDPLIIAGQGTAALEAAEAWPAMDAWVVGIGGGGLASGSAVALRHLRPDALIVGVEPEGAAAMRASLDAGEVVALERVDTIADGLAPVRPGDLTFRHVRALLDDVVTVPDDAILEAAVDLFHEDGIRVEFSGAAGVAALRTGAVDVRGRSVGVVLSGGNLDPALFEKHFRRQEWRSTP